jgi:putative phosphotransacetylase
VQKLMPQLINITRSEVEELVRKVVGQHTREFNQTKAVHLQVDASARHAHLCKADLETLFGPGAELTVYKDLYQAGNFAAKETLTLIGPKSRLISNLRILGPLRPESQVELAYSDAISLGYDNVPIRLSGDIEGTPGCFLMGPKGIIELKKGLIRAAIHVHMSPSEAEFYGVKHRDIMKLRVGGDAAVTFSRVHVRVDPSVRLNVHMDTKPMPAAFIWPKRSS